jgi:hypothetical protein
MSVIATLVEPHGVTRIFFDCRDTPPDPADQQRITQVIEQSMVMAQADGDASEVLARLRVAVDGRRRTAIRWLGPGAAA